MRLLDAQELAPARPECLQVVVGAFVATEEVDDDVAEVEEEPAVGGGAFAAMGAVVRGALDGLPQGFELPGRSGGGDDEEVGEAGDLADVEEDDLFGLAVGEFVDDAATEALGLGEAGGGGRGVAGVGGGGQGRLLWMGRRWRTVRRQGQGTGWARKRGRRS